MEYYNLTDSGLTSEEYDNSAWMSEYDQVCLLNLNQPLPTVPFNTSIVLATTTTSDATTTSGTTVTASSTPMPTPTSNISPNGLCGSANNGYTCRGSNFGDCCDIYGYWLVALGLFYFSPQH